MDTISPLVCILLGGIGSLNLFVLGLLLNQITGFRRDIKGIYAALAKKAPLNHMHNGGGRVVITGRSDG